MANINGTGKKEQLVGTNGDDVINGKGNDDELFGGLGNDVLIGGHDADKFFFEVGDGHDVITDFDPTEFDIIIFSYTEPPLEPISAEFMFDGAVLTGESGATFTFTAVDFDNDGATDTTIITSNGDSLTLLGWAPDELHGSYFVGG